MKRHKIRIPTIVIIVSLMTGMVTTASASIIEFAFTGHITSWSGDHSAVGTELTMNLKVNNYDDRITFRGAWNNESLWTPDVHQPYNQFASWNVEYSFGETFADLGWKYAGHPGAIAIENSPQNAYFESMFCGLSYMLDGTHYSLTQDGNRYALRITEYLPNGTYGQITSGIYEWDSVKISDVGQNLPVPEPGTAVLFLLGTGLTVLNRRRSNH